MSGTLNWWLGFGFEPSSFCNQMETANVFSPQAKSSSREQGVCSWFVLFGGILVGRVLRQAFLQTRGVFALKSRELRRWPSDAFQAQGSGTELLEGLGAGWNRLTFPFA